MLIGPKGSNTAIDTWVGRAYPDPITRTFIMNKFNSWQELRVALLDYCNAKTGRRARLARQLGDPAQKHLSGYLTKSVEPRYTIGKRMEKWLRENLNQEEK